VVCGRVDAYQPPVLRSGVNEKGKPYSFWQEVVTVTVGRNQYEVKCRTDKEPAAPHFRVELDEIVKLRVENPFNYNGSVSFDITKD